MTIGRISFSSHLSAEELQQRSLERLARETNAAPKPHYCNGRLHFLDHDAETCVCGMLGRSAASPKKDTRPLAVERKDA